MTRTQVSMGTLATIFAISMSTSVNTVLAADKSRGRESVEVSDHHRFGTGEIAEGATILVRDFRRQIVNATITTRALEPDTAYSIWWAVFNQPRYCAEPYNCTVADLRGDPRIKPSVFWGGGFVSDAFGAANTSLSLTRGRTTRELFAGGDYGLRNLRGAEIHVVLRTHGLAGLAGTIAEQVGTANLACPPENCANVFASIHKTQH